MRLVCKPDDLWVQVEGEDSELEELSFRLVAWSRTIDPVGCYAFKRDKEGKYKVLAGAAVALGLWTERPAARETVWPACLRLLEFELLRPYQAEAGFAALTAPAGHSILDVGMGGGKTRIAAGLAALGAALGYPRWLYLVQNQELAKQSETSFAQLLPPMTALLHTEAELLATTFSQVRKLGDRTFDGVIVDECHSLPAATRALGFARARSRFKTGLSGTALDRLDSHNALTVAMLGPVAYQAKVDLLEQGGFLTRGQVVKLAFDCRTGRLQRL